MRASNSGKAVAFFRREAAKAAVVKPGENPRAKANLLKRLNESERTALAEGRKASEELKRRLGRT